MMRELRKSYNSPIYKKWEINAGWQIIFKHQKETQ